MEMETAIKTTLARKNLEMEKLEQSKKSHLRMITSSAARLKIKSGRMEDRNDIKGETDARKIRMYETHNPGFCYLRNGEYRKKLTSTSLSSNADPVQCSEKLKTILFTDNELDIYKTVCLHLLSTHIENRGHIQRKDGRLCSYVKAQTSGNTANTLQPISQKVNNYAAEPPSKYDKMLPRYVLDVKILNYGNSASSFKTCDLDSGSDDETKRKRKLLVPIYINNEIKIIVNSVLEALDIVESSKLDRIIELASSPEELRHILSKEEMQEFITDLANNPLVMKPTSYDYVMAHLMFDKIPEKGTLETIAQVLEVYDDFELKKSLQQVRRGILLRHLELNNSNVLPRNKINTQEKFSSLGNARMSNPLINSSLIPHPQFKSMNNSDSHKKSISENLKTNKNEPIPKKENSTDTTKSSKENNKPDPNIVNVYMEKISTESGKEEEDSSGDENSQQSRGSIDSTKCDIHNLTNSQRILLGLKVASLKSRPINMHQFEGKKKVNLAEIISPIIRPQVSDIDYKQNSPENHLRNFALPEKKVKRSISKISTMSTTDLENLNRALLANLRLDISETENKKRVNQFMSKI